jgi:hypothetical protein
MVFHGRGHATDIGAEVVWLLSYLVDETNVVVLTHPQVFSAILVIFESVHAGQGVRVELFFMFMTSQLSPAPTFDSHFIGTKPGHCAPIDSIVLIFAAVNVMPSARRRKRALLLHTNTAESR